MVATDVIVKILDNPFIKVEKYCMIGIRFFDQLLRYKLNSPGAAEAGFFAIQFQKQDNSAPLQQSGIIGTG